jgi:carbonic anhydrase
MIRFTRAVVVTLSLAVVALGAQTKHWAYEDSAESVGPAKWGTLPGDEVCGAGKQQTPINLATAMAKPQDLPNLVFGYKPSSLSMTNNGHTVQVTYDAGSTPGRAVPDTGRSRNSTSMRRANTVDGASFDGRTSCHVDAAGKPIAVGVSSRPAG